MILDIFHGYLPLACEPKDGWALFYYIISLYSKGKNKIKKKRENSTSSAQLPYDCHICKCILHLERKNACKNFAKKKKIACA